VLEALIYTVAGLCVIQLRRRQPAVQRTFRIRGGWTIPIATIVIFGILGILAALNIDPQGTISPTPLYITLAVFAISAFYVYLGVPRIRAAAAARRAATSRRRPRRETQNTEVSQG
jgi:amino acid transporter